MILKFNINQQTIERQDTEKPVQHSKNYLKCQFTFSEEWEGLTKKVYFSNGTETKMNILNENNECSVPTKILNKSNLIISVKGYDYKNDVIISSNESIIRLKHNPKPKHKCPPRYSFYYNDCCHHHHHHDCCEEKVHHDVFDIIFKKLNSKIDNLESNDGKLYVYSDDELIEEIDISKGSEVDPVFTQSPANKITDKDITNIKKLPQTSTVINQFKDYLYETYYDKLDYDNAKEYFLNTIVEEVPSACSSIRKDNLFGRNYDWIYDECVDFIVKTPHKDGKFASIGVASSLTNLTDEFVKSKEPSEDYKLVPFFVVDGINEYGLTISTNVVPMDKTPTVETVPTVEKRDTLCTKMLPRYCLDYFKTASECVDYLEKYIALYVTKSLQEMHYEPHFLIADSEKTYLIELIDNRIVVVDMSDDSETSLSNKPFITNFYLSDVMFNMDGKVYTPETQDNIHNAKTINHITDNGCGLERYNLIVDNYENIETKEDLINLLSDLKYTNAYNQTSDIWYTEFVGISNLNVASEPSEFTNTIEQIKLMFNNRSRNKDDPNYGTWQTTHSSVYDIDEKTLNIIVQEDGEELEYSFDFYYTKKEVDELLSKYTIVDEITSESTDNELPTAKAVYDLVQQVKEIINSYHEL